ncbi:MAG TPA: hypothetical protein VEW64_09490 [Methyloceanibacter sp.]|jgi:hypothetical protein|nr:hypothetical protein [Methyloceanibacter sp.]
MAKPQIRLALLTALALLAPSLCVDRGHAGAPEQTAPQGEDPPGPDNGAPQTTPPAEHKGVIPPPDIGDEGIHTDVPDPNAGHDEEVIPPPGTSGGSPQ